MSRKPGGIIRGIGKVVGGTAKIAAGTAKAAGRAAVAEPGGRLRAATTPPPPKAKKAPPETCEALTRGFNRTIPCGKKVKRGYSGCGDAQHEALIALQDD